MVIKSNMKYLLLTFDTEELSITPRNKTNEKRLFELGNSGTQKVLDLLKKKGVKATFFVTNEFAQHNSPTVKRILKEGHELASHGYSHEHDYNKMPEEEALFHIKKSKSELEKKFKTTVLGFRAPRMGRPSYRILHEAGFKYDSSLHPTWVPGRYNNMFKTRKPFKAGGIFEIPVSVAAGLRLPFSWFWFRNFGLGYAKVCSRLALLNSNYINIYFHPWDFINLNKLDECKDVSKLIKNNSGEKALGNLEKYIDWCLSKKLRPITLKRFVLSEFGE